MSSLPNLASLGDLFADEPVIIAYLFGSQARGDAGPLSDVDVAVLVKDDLSPGETLSLRLRLMEAVGRALRADRVDVLVLNGAPYLLQHRAIRDGTVWQSGISIFLSNACWISVI